MSKNEELIKRRLDDVERLQNSDKFEEAIEVCDEIISLDSECYMAFSRRSDIYHRMGQHEAAFHDLDRLMKIRPECPSAYYVSARWNLELGNDRAAIDDANFVIKSGEQYFIKMAYFFRSIAFMNLGNKKAALDDCHMLPDEFRTALTLYKTGWKVLSRADLLEMINS
jgi:tetratricopeptide (TPR) repeat protein